MSGETIVEYTIICPSNVDLSFMLTELNGFVSTLCHDYIWQKESFKLHVSSETEHSLIGSTNVGENINDEWFIVFLLLQLSKQYTEVTIRVIDNDGCFILIQAADYLPRWVKPDNSDNRLFIHDGSIHLIPYPSSPAEITLYPGGIPTLQEAYRLVTNSNIKTKASDEIQECIFKQIKDYPDKIHQDFHHAHCLLPEQIVYMLQKNPCLIASAVEAFYNRDHLDVKACKKLSNFYVKQQVCANVRFTRHLYSQLQQANFYPDRKSKWALPSFSDKLYKAKELGFKLACGFEILISRYKASQHDGEPYGKKWEKYLANLQKNGFFQNELEGSRKYKVLLEEAKKHFKQNVSESADEFGDELLRLLNEAALHKIEIQEICKVLKDEDSDDWMTVTPEELDRMMIGMWGEQRPLASNDDPKEGETEELSRLVDNMKLFVDKVSSYEGVEIPDDGDNNGDKADSKRPKSPKNSDKIDFDPKKFMESIQDLLSPPRNTSDTLSDDSDFNDEEIDDDFISCDPLNGTDENELHGVMYKMDDELQGTNISRSFKDDKKVEEGDDECLNYDVNLVKNFLESFSSQHGLSGPVSNIIQSMGLSLPPNIDDG